MAQTSSSWLKKYAISMRAFLALFPITLLAIGATLAAVDGAFNAVFVEAEAAGQGIAVAYAHWTAAILANGLGRYADALAAATPYLRMFGIVAGGWVMARQAIAAATTKEAPTYPPTSASGV